MNIEDIKAARDAVNSAKNEYIGQKQLCIYVGMSEIDTLSTLLDNAINAPDLESLKREVKELASNWEVEVGTPVVDIIDLIIDYLAPRIVREGCVCLPIETLQIVEDALKKNLGYFDIIASITKNEGWQK